MKKIYFALFLLVSALSNDQLFAQLSAGGTPLSIITPDDFHPNRIELPPVNLDMLRQEDEINDQNKDIPWRFGENISVDIDIKANPRTYVDSGFIWLVKVHSPGAVSLNFTFDQFMIPEGARLFIYSERTKEVLGAFTQLNNHRDKMLATVMIFDDHAIIEYYEPEKPKFNGLVHLGTITHGYRTIRQAIEERSFGDAGACHINVNCPSESAWQNEKKSVVMLIVNGNIACSGAVLNSDPVYYSMPPLILTANHCWDSDNPTTWLAVFNWESPNCDNPASSPASNSLSGGSMRARKVESDFFLLELHDHIPAYFEPYYAGWDRSGNVPSQTTGIHHPQSDIKKISHDNHAALAWPPPPVFSPTIWRVEWDNGVTEPGSSGSPLFDQNHRVIGQLWSGNSACGGNDMHDNYGQLMSSWDGPASNRRLWDHLSPEDHDRVTMPGRFFRTIYEDIPNIDILSDRTRSIIISARCAIPENRVSVFDATESCTFLPGFEAKTGCVFTAFINLAPDPYKENPDESNRLGMKKQTERSDQDKIEDKITASPNPFTTSTAIAYQLDEPENVEIRIFNATGLLIATPVQPQRQEAGDYSFTFAADDLPAGVYFLVAQLGDRRVTKRLVRTQ